MKGRRRCVGQQESCGFDFPTGALLSFHVLLISLDSRQVHHMQVEGLPALEPNSYTQ